MTRPSGPAWCDEFPCSVLMTNLAQPFRANAENFVEALERAGASVVVSTTFRPPERAYLMHWSWMIAHGRARPQDVPTADDIAIDWTHGGRVDEALRAAEAMVRAYGISPKMHYPPSLTSRHTQGRAVDMTIRWRGLIKVTDARGVVHECTVQEDLWPIGASYGVHKLPTDPPHWSDDGH